LRTNHSRLQTTIIRRTVSCLVAVCRRAVYSFKLQAADRQSSYRPLVTFSPFPAVGRRGKARDQLAATPPHHTSHFMTSPASRPTPHPFNPRRSTRRSRNWKLSPPLAQSPTTPHLRVWFECQQQVICFGEEGWGAQRVCERGGVSEAHWQQAWSEHWLCSESLSYGTSMLLAKRSLSELVSVHGRDSRGYLCPRSNDCPLHSEGPHILCRLHFVLSADLQLPRTHGPRSHLALDLPVYASLEGVACIKRGQVIG
jgi:hypothetical protein